MDEAMLAALDRVAKGRGKRALRGGRPNRSQMVRQAVSEFLARHARGEAESAEWEVWLANLDRINRQSAALVAEQAEP
jgi:metal-responsive CopG/Arc/MetJ family transcriptional regulator